MVSEYVDEPGQGETAALVAGVAHEINNPITYVLANLADLEGSCHAISEVLAGYRAELRAVHGERADSRIADLERKLDECGGVPLATELLADATEGAVRIRDLVRELLSLARPGERTRAPLALEDALEQTLRLVSRSIPDRTELVRDFQATRALEGDRARLGQVFLNLLRNAIDACGAAPERAHRIAVRTCDCVLGVRIEIEDDGPGIPDEIAASIFAPFFTTKPQGAGTGLGLYISRRIVAEHGGTLEWLRAGTGGTIFRVELPAPG
jgi:two-component system NtrC family sensor kinase